MSGHVREGTRTPRSEDLPPARLEAVALGTYWCSLTMFIIRSRVLGSTSGLLFSTRDTVAVDTPARLAMSLMVNRFGTICNLRATAATKDTAGSRSIVTGGDHTRQAWYNSVSVTVAITRSIRIVSSHCQEIAGRFALPTHPSSPSATIYSRPVTDEKVMAAGCLRWPLQGPAETTG